MTALILSLLSFAQDAPEAAAPGVLTGYVWASEPLKPLRWPSSGVTVGDVELGERVEVVLVDGDQVRIRSGLSFGWVPTSALTATDPAAIELPDLDFDLGAPGEITLIDEEAPEPPAVDGGTDGQ